MGTSFSGVGGWFPTETAPSEPAALFFLAIWSRGRARYGRSLPESGEPSVAHGAVDQRGGHVLVAEHAPQPENPMFVAWMTLRVSWESDMTWNRSPEPSSPIGM